MLDVYYKQRKKWKILAYIEGDSPIFFAKIRYLKNSNDFFPLRYEGDHPLKRSM